MVTPLDSPVVGFDNPVLGFDNPVLGFDRAATTWIEALPLGNGRIGAMVFGDPHDERIALNEGSVWSGSPRNEDSGRVSATTAREAVARARSATLERRFAEATRQVQRLQGRYSQAFLPFGDLRLTIRDANGKRGRVTTYHRELDLGHALHSVRCRLGGAAVRRTDFISHPDRVLVVVLESSEPLRIVVGLDSPLSQRAASVEAGRLVRVVRAPTDVPPPHECGRIRWAGGVHDAVRAAAVIGWEHDGVDEPEGNARLGGNLRFVGNARLGAHGVRRLTLCLAIETTFTGLGEAPTGDVSDALARARDRVEAALSIGAERLRERHVADYRELFDRTRVRLGSAPEPDTLDTLAFDFGRYLLISSSRPGGVPASLQGLWNERLRPPWSSNYTLNINTEMNYWAAESVGLPETTAPLFDLVEALARRGSETARRLYDARGWVAHHNTDIWAYTSPVGKGKASPAWAFWPMAGAWLSLAFAEHVRFHGDRDFACERAFPVLRGAALFLLDWFVDVDGVPTTAPATSPENTFRAGRGRFAVGRSATMDIALATELFSALAEVAAVAGLDADPVVAEALALRDRLPRVAPGRNGLIPEWADDDPQAERSHRHISHLFGLYPGTTLRDDEQRAAARASLDARGDDSTGWSLMWKIAARARLRDTDAIDRLLTLVFRRTRARRIGQHGGLYPNLLAAHPPFQIDGNFDYLAGVVECLVHSDGDVLCLLPAVPRRWLDGEASGLIARPGVRVDLRWHAANGSARLDGAVLTPLTDAARRVVTVEVAGRHLAIDLRSGHSAYLSAADLNVATEVETR